MGRENKLVSAESCLCAVRARKQTERWPGEAATSYKEIAGSWLQWVHVFAVLCFITCLYLHIIRILISCNGKGGANTMRRLRLHLKSESAWSHDLPYCAGFKFNLSGEEELFTL